MATVFDIANLILARQGKISTARLHKLLYFVQAWSLARTDEPAFLSTIKAWKNGPVITDVHAELHGRRYVDLESLGARVGEVPANVTATVDFVLESYGTHDTDHLIALTHFDEPWNAARATKRSSPEIPQDALRLYYGGKSPAGIEQAYQLRLADELSARYADALRRLAR